MASVDLPGWIPVTVVVDVDTKKVTDVRAYDTEFHYGDLNEDELPPWVPNPEEKAAQDIAEDVIWPAWEWS